MNRIFLIAGFIIVIFITAYVTMVIFIKGEEVKVPSVVGIKLEQASEVCSSSGLILKEKNRRFDDVVPEDHIIDQEPSADDFVKKGRRVLVLVSKGSKMTSVPDFYLQPLTRVNVVTANSGLVVGNVAKAYSDYIPANKIISQNPTPQQLVKKGTIVSLLVSKGGSVSYYLMPDLVGKKINSAKKILSRIGIEKVKLHLKKNDKLNNEIVLAQKPVENSIVNSEIDVEIEVNDRSLGIVEDAPSEVSNLHYIQLYFDVPENGNIMKRVKIILIDNDARTEVFNEMRESGTRVETFIRASGNAKIEIYVNENLVEERKL